MLSRRTFLKASSLVSLSPVLPRILGKTARAAAAGPDARVLVVIQLDGGNDGINTVVPHADDAYGRSRIKLRLDPKELHQLDDRVALHDSMRGAKELFDDGRLCVVQNVGYPNPDRSHFRSMKIWQTARFDQEQYDHYGWLGTALDQQAGQANASAIYVGEEQTPVALWGRRSSATALAAAQDLELTLNVQPGSQHHAGPKQEEASLAPFVSKQVLSAYAAADEFARHSSQRAAGGSTYPDTTLAAQLKLVSQLLQSGMHGRVFYTVQGGYDTHAAQTYTHWRLLREFSGAVKAFLDDLKSVGLDDRVVLLAFSEFGRRLKENDSQGTDHGAAGPVFLAGKPVRAGLVGEAPNLTDLDDGDIKMQIDFRQVYATLLDDWLSVDSKAVLGGAFEKAPVLAGA